MMSAGYRIERRRITTSLDSDNMYRVSGVPDAESEIFQVAPPTIITSTVNGVSMDAGIGSFFAIQSVGQVSGTSPTLTGKFQESDTGSGSWTDVTGSTLTTVTGANNIQAVAFTTTKRYLRYVGTVGGTTPIFRYGTVLVKQTSTFAEIGTSPTPDYTDSTVVTGGEYEYRVRAEDGSGNLSDYSDAVNIFAATPFTIVGPAVTGTAELTVPEDIFHSHAVVISSGAPGQAGTVDDPGYGGPSGACLEFTINQTIVSGSLLYHSNQNGGSYCYFYNGAGGSTFRSLGVRSAYDQTAGYIAGSGTAVTTISAHVGAAGGAAGAGGGGGGGEAASTTADGNAGSAGEPFAGGAGGTGGPGADGGAGGAIGNNPGIIGTGPGAGGGGGGKDAGNPAGGAGVPGQLTFTGYTGATGLPVTCPMWIYSITNSGGFALITTFGDHGYSGAVDLTIFGTSVPGYNVAIGSFTTPTPDTLLTDIAYSSTLGGSNTPTNATAVGALLT